MTEEQVLQHFVKDVGGIHVLSEPPDKGFNRLAWAVPYAVGLGSFAAIRPGRPPLVASADARRDRGPPR